MKATERDGSLKSLNSKCYLDIPGYQKIQIRILPDYSDKKSAKYSDEPVIGRSTPLKSYSHSDGRAISLKLVFLSLNKSELQENKYNFFAISSLTYPRQGVSGPYAPPPICKYKCGDLLGDTPLNLILDSYDLSVPTDVVWDDETLIPYYFTLSTSWSVVYNSGSLPNQEDVLLTGGL